MSVRSEQTPASMSSFVDFATTAGPPRITTVADHKRNQHNAITDFYRPLRETIARVGREGLEAAPVFDLLLMQTGDMRAQNIYPAIIDGHRRFREEHTGAWVEPTTAAFKVGTGGFSIAVNPEVGFVIAGVPHHLKLYMRSDALSQRRVDFTVAVMAVALPIPKGHRIAVLDLRNAELHYLSKKASEPNGWKRLTTLVHVEAAAFAEAWGRV